MFTTAPNNHHPRCSRLKTGYSLHTFDAGFNDIKILESGSLLANLTHIYVNNNSIANVSEKSFLGLDGLRLVDLQGNSLASLALPSMSSSYGPRLLLADNPWTCDCSLSWMRAPAGRSGIASAMSPTIGDLNSIVCSSTGLSLVSIPPSDLLCEYSAHCQPDCFCCDFFACDCRMQCPDGCSCFHDSQWTVNKIECSGRNHTDVPALIPMDATEIFLDGNNMTELIGPGFIGRRHVAEVFLNNSKIVTIGPLSLEGLTGTKVLHLEDNQLEELFNRQFSGLVALRQLHLQRNLLSRIAANAFEGLDRLEVLRLEGNQLASLSFNPPHSAALTLGNNPWSCDCTQKLSTLKEVLARVEDKMEVACASSSLPVELMECESSPLTQPSSLMPIGQTTDFTPITIGVLLAVFLVIVVYLAAFAYRRRIRGCCPGKAVPAPVLEGRLFDVFLTYSLEDRALAEDSLAPALEQGPGPSYRLCLHQRDFPASTPLHDAVTVASESSSRTLLLLSPSFVATQWPLVRGPLLSLPPGRLLLLQLAPLAPLDLAPHPELRRLLEGGPLLR